MSRRAGVIGRPVALGAPLVGLRAARRPWGPGLLVGAAALGCVLLALAPGGTGPLAARATLAALAIGVGWRLLRTRAAPQPPAMVRVAGLVPLGRAGQVAVLEVDGRRFLVAAGERPLSLLAELGPSLGRAP